MVIYIIFKSRRFVLDEMSGAEGSAHWNLTLNIWILFEEWLYFYLGIDFCLNLKTIYIIFKKIAVSCWMKWAGPKAPLIEIPIPNKYDQFIFLDSDIDAGTAGAILLSTKKLYYLG